MAHDKGKKVCTHIDWSADSKYMQSNDGAYEILYWFDWDGAVARQEGKRENVDNFVPPWICEIPYGTLGRPFLAGQYKVYGHLFRWDRC